MKFVLSLVLATVFLSGCANKAPIASIATVNPTDPGVSGIDVYAPRRERGEKVPNFRGDQFVTVRTYEEDPEVLSNFGKELLGSSCVLEGAGYSASVTTPAKVRVPIYGNESTDISVECNHSGYQKAIATKRSFDKTKSDRLSAGSSGGLIGVVFMAAVNAASDDKEHVFLYPDINLIMRPNKSGRLAKQAQ